ncbi:bifunctional folylpolyglutamate synthase/dihydrofolate synthase [Chthonobacter rhizosphaerae]|uniref:bifunctional folylpolyglutamate synthase/dihydrofolate synthase n=1 Tax=Chthonobacter rhizosphaerae TaxID=2735553 RepID=UPI0015EF4947|nr:folylpolyglutamate synthase/dihydrofolate synthase family protein [Chthonobacter rhizosphaerae]
MTRSLAIIDRLAALHPKGYDLTLGRIQRLLKALGSPETRIPPVFHVAGTNGKGSTVAFLRAILEAAGLRVHTDTSPHLVSYNERYRLATGPGTSAFVDDDRFADALARAEAANGQEPITLFELLTAAGFLLFAETPADVVLLEVGLGGRFDSTNVIDEPLVSVITSISLDHQAFLGDTVEKIAFEKAGIIKGGRPVVLSPNGDSIREVFERVVRDVKAGPLYVGGQDFTAFEEHGRLVFQDADGLLDLPLPRLLGRHQIQNAGTAIAAIRASGLDIPTRAFETGLETVDWPARLQRLTHGALVTAAPAGSEVWLDGGHNPGAGEVVASAMADLEDRLPRPLFLIAGMLTTKDPAGFFGPFAGLVRHVFTVPIPQSEAAWAPEPLAEAAIAAGLSAQPVSGPEEALRLLGEGWQFERSPRILICGSLYLAGDVLALNGTPPR